MPSIRHPGVFVHEISSGPRAIAGVPTSVAAFVGRARRGPPGRPVRVTDRAELERLLGAPWKASTLVPAVAAFLDNGGAEALVVRAVGRGAAPARARLGDGGELELEAASPGAWGNALVASRRPGAAAKGGRRFDLELVDRGTGVRETHADLAAAAGDGRCVADVLERESSLARARRGSPVPTGPERRGVPFAGGDDGSAPLPADVVGTPRDGAGLCALDGHGDWALLCIPPLLDDHGGEVEMRPVLARAADRAHHHRALLLADPPSGWRTAADAAAGAAELRAAVGHPANVALYWPRVRAAANGPDAPPCGAVAGVCARTDRDRGVWKAPAGTAATLRGVAALAAAPGGAELDALNAAGVNALREHPGVGPLVWGARTLVEPGSPWQYVPVRRLALFLEESIHRGLQWAVFEPNDEALWVRVRAAVDAFLQMLYRAGAFPADRPDRAWFVRCDASTTAAVDVERGVLNVLVGFAPLKPAEFLVLRFHLRMER